ncbi:membrane transporter [Coprinopsis sp. MPI-PUGE-AT-0042]|nr:membrane transporter [Coprinopsis sp. MPI-PUGE-AT-0042]
MASQISISLYLPQRLEASPMSQRCGFLSPLKIFLCHLSRLVAAQLFPMASNEKVHDSDNEITVQARDVDTAVLVADDSPYELTPDAAKALRKKIDRNLMPLMCFTFVIMIAGQVVIVQSAILGIFQGAHLSQDQFNWLATILYVTILASEYPQNLALQRFPVGKWMSFNIIIWSIALLGQAACRSFGALVACRIVLGMCESVIMPGFMLVTSMFYTRSEHTKRVGYWYMAGMGGSSFLGLVAFGLLHITGTRLMPWQWMMIIMGIVTFLFGIVFFFLFPDSPTSARFLSPEERTLAVERIKVNQSGVENKTWKKTQFIEALTDLKVWIMAGFAFLSHVPVSMTFQKQIIVSQLGFDALQTTLLSCADGAITILGISVGVYLSCVPSIGRGYATVLTSIPPLIGSILINVLPGENKIALLFMYWLSYWVSIPYTIFLGWVTSLVAGHTKRITTNAIVLISAYLGLAVGPLMWKKKYQPRNRIPWIVVSISVFICALLLLWLRTVLHLENKRREREPKSTKYDKVFIKKTLDDGTVDKQHVDKAFLDLTDIENRDFRYIL